MVMQLPLPGACSLALVDQVVAERQGGVHALFFTGIAAQWRARIQQYTTQQSPVDRGQSLLVDIVAEARLDILVRAWPEVERH